MSHRRRRAGRPRKANAKHRATTTAGRAPDRDLGSPELVYRKARAANGAAATVELVDVAGILCARGLIEPDELGLLRQLAAWLRQLARAYGLSQASPAGLWAQLLSGQRAGARWLDTPGGDRAAMRLAELFEYFAQLDQPAHPRC
jgi:hypothetical protein